MSVQYVYTSVQCSAVASRGRGDKDDFNRCKRLPANYEVWVPELKRTLDVCLIHKKRWDAGKVMGFVYMWLGKRLSAEPFINRKAYRD